MVEGKDGVARVMVSGCAALPVPRMSGCRQVADHVHSLLVTRDDSRHVITHGACRCCLDREARGEHPAPPHRAAIPRILARLPRRLAPSYPHEHPRAAHPVRRTPLVHSARHRRRTSTAPPSSARRRRLRPRPGSSVLSRRWSWAHCGGHCASWWGRWRGRRYHRTTSASSTLPSSSSCWRVAAGSSTASSTLCPVPPPLLTTGDPHETPPRAAVALRAVDALLTSKWEARRGRGGTAAAVDSRG